MVIYIVYQKFYADFENGEDDALFIECGYKNKRKAVKKAAVLDIGEGENAKFIYRRYIRTGDYRAVPEHGLWSSLCTGYGERLQQSVVGSCS